MAKRFIDKAYQTGKSKKASKQGPGPLRMELEPAHLHEDDRELDDRLVRQTKEVLDDDEEENEVENVRILRTKAGRGKSPKAAIGIQEKLSQSIHSLVTNTLTDLQDIDENVIQASAILGITSIENAENFKYPGNEDSDSNENSNDVLCMLRRITGLTRKLRAMTSRLRYMSGAEDGTTTESTTFTHKQRSKR